MPASRLGSPSHRVAVFNNPRHPRIRSLQAAVWFRNALELYPFEKQGIPVRAKNTMRDLLRGSVYAQLPAMASLSSDSSTCWTILRQGDCERLRLWRTLINDSCLVAWCQQVRADCNATSLQELIRRRCQLIMSTSYSALVQATVVDIMSTLFIFED
jgi:hypothetical protein